MSTREIIDAVGALLKPLGFTGPEAVWNRRVDGVVEAVELQLSKARDAVTVNAGVLDPEVYQTLWGSEPPRLVEVPLCTVGVRVGELGGGRDRWWPIDVDPEATTLVPSVSDHVLPFLERMRSRAAMAQWLTDTQVQKKKYPPPILSLAILQSLLGRRSDACSLLADVEKDALGGWRARTAEVSARLRCNGGRRDRP
jgi:hypothetical protein